MTGHTHDNKQNVPWYASPKQIRDWGEPEPVWHDHFGLFYDLVFVGGAYVAGLTLKQDLTTTGVLTFVGYVLLLRDAWNSREGREARFESRSFVHSGLDLVELTLTMTMVLMMESTDRMFDPGTTTALGLMLTFLASKVVVVFRAWDIGRHQTTSAGRGYFRRELGLTGSGLAIVGGLAAVVYCLMAPRLDELWVFLFVCTLSRWAAILVKIQTTRPMGETAFQAAFVPLCIEYSIERNLEWMMLMVGEAVFSLLIVPVEHTTQFYIIFIVGCVSVSCVFYQQLNNYMLDSSRHALKLKALRGFMFEVSRVVLSVTLVAYGVSFKVLLEKADKSTLDPKYIKLYAIPLGLSLFISDLSWVLNDTGVQPPGFVNYWKTVLQNQHTELGRRVLRIWIAKLAIVAVCFSMESMDLDAIGVSLLGCALTIVAATLGALRTHPCYSISKLYETETAVGDGKSDAQEHHQGQNVAVNPAGVHPLPAAGGATPGASRLSEV